MIEQKLQDKVETVIADAIESEAKNTNPAIDPVLEENLAQTDIQDVEQPAILEETATAQPEAEPVQVAGLGGVGKAVLEGLKDRTLEAEKRVTMDAEPPSPIQQVEQSLVIAPADPDEVLKINEQLGGEYAKGLNFPAIFEAGQDFDAATYLSKFKDANQELFENARRGTISFDSMLEMAKERGLDQIVFDMAKRNPGDVMPPEDFLAGMLAYSQLLTQSRTAWNDAFALPQGPEREAALQRALQLSTVHSHVAVNLSGSVSEAARTVQLAGELKRRGIPDVTQELTLFGAKTAQDIEYVGRHYLAITNPTAMARFVQKAANAKSMDMITEVWINSILTSPVTHMVNIAGNAVYGALNNVETFVAAGFGKLRSKVTGNQDRVRAVEGVAQLEGLRRSLVDSLLMAGKVGLTETPTDLASKIDVRTRRAIGTTGDPRDVIQMIREGDMGAAAVNTFGIYARLGGRALLMEDEFFKGIAGRSELYRQAEIRAADIYRTTIETGGTPEQAKQAAALERANIINNPPEEIKKTVANAAKELTFQGDLDGFLGQMQGSLNHPIAKLFIPFYKTPVNVMKATLERTPLALAFPKTREALAKGGRDADIAVSKIATGSAIMSTFAYAAFGFDQGEDKSLVIIGNGPSDREARDAMMRQGFMPYTINIRQEDGSYKSITYSRFDPVSGVLAIAADFAYYSQYETDQNTLDQLAMAASVGVAEYLIDMPLLQGLSEIQGAMMNPDPVSKFDALTGLLAQKGTEAALSVLPGTGAFTAGVARVEDPTARNTMLPEQGLFGEDPTTLPAFARGFYEALQKAKSRNPFFNQDLPPRLNEWGEEMKVGKGVWWEFWSPVRINDARYTTVDQELMNLGDGIPRTPKKLSGVLLNGEQYNKYIKLTNSLDESGYGPGHPDYDPSTTLLVTLEQVIVDPEYQALPTREDKLNLIKGIVSTYRSVARQKLLAEDPRLRGKVNSVL